MTGAGEKSEGSDDEQEEQEEYTTGGVRRLGRHEPLCSRYGSV